MKYVSKICIMIFLIVITFNYCQANPLSTIYSFFQRDLTIDVLFKDHKNILPGSPVYLAESADAEKIQIGEVKKISLVPTEMSKVEIVINNKFKKKIYKTAQFVLVSSLFSKKADEYILVVVPPDASGTEVLKSGDLVNGMGYLEYRISDVGNELTKWADKFGKQNKILLDELESYIENLDTELFLEKLDDITGRIKQFSNEQKTAFEKNVLPELKKTIDEFLKKLENGQNAKEQEDIEKRLNEIETIIKT